MTIFSCKDCGNRYPGCHGHCETYIKEKAEHEERRMAQAKQTAIENGLYNQRYSAVRKAVSRSLWKNRYGQRRR